MKKLFTIVCTLVLGCAMSFAQGGSGSKGSDAQNPTAGDKATTSKKGAKKHHHKGGKKGKKTAAAPAPAPSPK